MPVLNDERFHNALGQLPAVNRERAADYIEKHRPRSGTRKDLTVWPGDWAEEVVARIDDARYFLAAAKFAFEVGPLFYDQEGEYENPIEVEEHERFCFAALWAIFSAWDKIAQLVNSALNLGDKPGQVIFSRQLTRLSQIEIHSREIATLWSDINRNERFQQGARLRHARTHKHNAVHEARFLELQDDEYEIEFGKDLMGPEDLEKLADRHSSFL